MEGPDPQETQAMPVDPMKTALGAPTPASAAGATQAISPVQCPICKQINPPGELYCVECGLLFSQELGEEVSVAPEVPLPCLVDTKSGREHPLRPGPNSIGRDGTDVLLTDTRVSRRHAELVLTEDGATLEDLGSTNGTMIGTQKLEAGEKVPVSHGAKLFFGGLEMELSLPGIAMRTEAMPGPTEEEQPEEAPGRPVVARLEAVDGTTYAVYDGETTLGRRSSNDIKVADPYVSGNHAKFIAKDDGLFFVDVGSTNGSAVNGEKAEPNAEIAVSDGDEIMVGQQKLVLRLAGEGE
jgi:pSer/pThr/pTyr-binding forkhead associated (FHA) protein